MDANILPRAAIILVNYSGYAKNHLKTCYQGLLSQDFPKEQTTLFISDNGSTQESRADIQEIAPSIRIVSNPENRGWTGGINAAIRVALQEGYDYFVILNMDTQFEADWLSQLVKKAQTRKDLHILQPVILLSGTRKVNSVGNRIHFLGYGNCNGYAREFSDQLHAQYSMDYASGAAMLVKREVFGRIGLFREEYFIYYDDQEFCWRAQLAGLHVGLAEKSICYHDYHFQKILNSIYLAERNRLVTLLTLEKIGTFLLILPPLILVQAGSILYFILKGRGPVMLQLIQYFLKWNSWKTILAYRRENNRLRVKKDSQIVKKFSGSITFAEIHSRIFRFLINPLLWAYWAVVRRFILW